MTVFDPSHPREKPCGGGLTGKGLALLPPGPDHDPLPAHFVGSCRFESGTGAAVDVTLDQPVAVVSRREFDGWLLRRALDEGVRHIAERVDRLEEPGRVRTRQGREERFDVVVGADGAGSLVRRTLLRPLPKERLHVAAGWYAPGACPMTVRFIPGLDGYLWLFPRRDHVAVGISCPLAQVQTRALLDRLHREVAVSFPALAGGADLYAHTIPAPTADPGCILEIAGETWALVGDAAALADPITGEGIYPALHSAEVLAATLGEDGSPRRYPERLLEAYGRELLKAARLKSLFYAPGFSERMVQASARSRAIRRVLADLVLGQQGYLGLKRRLLWAGPRYLFDSALAALRVA